MWGWKHSLKGASNTEYSPPVITYPFFPTLTDPDGNTYPMAGLTKVPGEVTLEGDQYWFSGGGFIPEYDVSYSTSSDLNGGLAYVSEFETRTILQNPSGSQRREIFDINVASSFNFIDTTAQPEQVYRQYISFDVQNGQSDPYGAWDAAGLEGQSPDLYSTLAISAIKPLEYYDLENEAPRTGLVSGYYTVQGFESQDFPFFYYTGGEKFGYGFNGITGYVRHHSTSQSGGNYYTTNYENLDYWMNNFKTVAGTTSLACSYQIHRWKAVEPYNWRGATGDLGGPANVDSGTDKKMHTGGSQYGAYYEPDETERLIHYYAGKTVKRTGDYNVPDTSGPIDITFEIELALQRYGVATSVSTIEAPNRDEATNAQRVMSYVAGNFCFSQDELNLSSGNGTYLLVPVFAAVNTLGGPNEQDTDNSGQGLTEYERGQLPTVGRTGGHCYKYLIVAIRLEKRYMPGSYIVGSGMVVDFENFEKTYNSQIAAAAGYYQENNTRWPALANRKNARLFSPEFISNSEEPNYGFEVTCFRVSECGAYGFYSGGSTFNIKYGGSLSQSYDQTDTSKMITRFRVNTTTNGINSDVFGRHFWHMTSDVSPHYGADPFNHAQSDFCDTIVLDTNIPYALGYDSEARPRVTYDGQFIKSFRFSNDGKYLYVLWQTRQGFSDFPANRTPVPVMKQWVERYFISSPHGYSSHDFFYPRGNYATDTFKVGYSASSTTYGDANIFFAGTTGVYDIPFDGDGGYKHAATSIDVTPDGMYLQLLKTSDSGNYLAPTMMEYFLGGSGDSNLRSPAESYSTETQSTNALLTPYRIRQKTREFDGTIIDPPYLGTTTDQANYKFVWPVLNVVPGDTRGYDTAGGTQTFVRFGRAYTSQIDYQNKENAVIPTWSDDVFQEDSEYVLPVPVDFSWNADGTILYLFGAYGAEVLGQNQGLNHYEGSPFCMVVPLYQENGNYPGTNSFQERAGSGNLWLNYEYLYANRVEGLKKLADYHFPGISSNLRCPIYPVVERQFRDNTPDNEREIISMTVTLGTYNGTGSTITDSFYIYGEDWGRRSTIPSGSSASRGKVLSLRKNVIYRFRQNDPSNVGEQLTPNRDAADGVHWTYTGTAGIDGLLELRIDESATVTDIWLEPPVSSSSDSIIIQYTKIPYHEALCIPLWKGATTVDSYVPQQPEDMGVSLLWKQPWKSFPNDVNSAGWLHKNRNAIYKYFSESRPQAQQAANVFAYHKGGRYLYFIAQDDVYNVTVNGSDAGTDPTLPNGLNHTYYRNYVAILPIFTNAEETLEDTTDNGVVGYEEYLGKFIFSYNEEYRDWGYVMNRGVWGPWQVRPNDQNGNTNIPSPRQWGAIQLSMGEGTFAYNMMSTIVTDSSPDLNSPRVEFTNYYEGPRKGGVDFFSWNGQNAKISVNRYKGITSYNNDATPMHSAITALGPKLVGLVHPVYRAMGERNYEWHYVNRDIRGGNWGVWIGQRGNSNDAPIMSKQLYWGYNNSNTFNPQALWNSTFLSNNLGHETDIANPPKYVWGIPNVTERNPGSENKVYSHLIDAYPDIGYYVTQKESESQYNLSTAGLAHQNASGSFDPPFEYDTTNALMNASDYSTVTLTDVEYEPISVLTSNDIMRVMSFRFAEDGKSLFILTSGELIEVNGAATSNAAWTLTKYSLTNNYSINNMTRVGSFTLQEDRVHRAYWWSQINNTSKSSIGTDFVLHPDGTKFWVIGLESTQTNYFFPSAQSCRTVVQEFNMATAFDLDENVTRAGFHTYDNIPALSNGGPNEIPVSLEVDATGENVYWTSQHANEARTGTTKKIRHFRSPLQTSYDLRSPTTSTTSNTSAGLRTQAGTNWFADDGAAQRIRFGNTNDRWYRNGVSDFLSDTDTEDMPNWVDLPVMNYTKRVALNPSLGTISAFDKPGAYKTQKPAGSFSMGNAGMLWDRYTTASISGAGGKRQNQAETDIFHFEISKNEDVLLLSDTQRIVSFLFNNHTRGT